MFVVGSDRFDDDNFCFILAIFVDEQVQDVRGNFSCADFVSGHNASVLLVGRQ